MTNSLFKDSHITHYCRLQNSTSHSERRVHNSMSTAATVKNSSIIVRKPAEISFSGLPNANKKSFDFYTSKQVKKFLILAQENQVVYSAGFALLLTCLLRPASIMALPSDKRNKDDKKYAAAHSIASGVIGFTISSIVANPISAAVKKVLKRPTLFGVKNAAWLKDKYANSFASNYLNKIPDIFMSVPKGIATIALIPIILKYVFGWEKKKPEDKMRNNSQNIQGGVK